MLRDAGIGGIVSLYLFIDVDGIVQDCGIERSSGHRGLDDVAVALGTLPRFSPARNQEGEAVPALVTFPFEFQAR